MADQAAIETKNVAGAITSMGIDELISNLAVGIAKGQMQLDQVCMDIARFMGDAQVAFGKRPGSEEPDLISLIELGFTPNFYQFVDTILEVRVAVSSKFEETRQFDTSQTQLQQQEYAAQSQYEAQSSNAYSGGGYSAGFNWGWGGYSYGANSYGYAGSSSASAGSSSSIKSKNLALTTVDAKYASTYNYAVEASSLIKTKIVPVPPPEVFEETVRAKIQERRDWENQQRLIEQVKAILPGLSGAADTILTNADFLPADVTSYKWEDAVGLQNALKKLNEDYGALTTAHWAIIQSVEDRSVADTALGDSIKTANDIVATFPDKEAGSFSTADSDVLSGMVTNLGNYLTRFKDKIDEILNRIAPPEQQGGA